MFDAITDAVASLNNIYVISLLVLTSAALLLYDYLSVSDWPAHVGYALFSVATFLLAPYGWTGSIVAGLVVWVFLSALHWKLLYRYLSSNENGLSLEEPSSTGNMPAPQ
jgi:membrane protein implicated in regulation of membrane protease activity